MPLVPGASFGKRVKTIANNQMMKGRVHKLARNQELDAKRRAQAADWHERYNKKLKETQNKDLAKVIAKRKAIAKSKAKHKRGA